MDVSYLAEKAKTTEYAEKNTTLSMLREGECANVRTVMAEARIRRRLFDIGLIEGTKIECLNKSPLGDPVAYLIRGAVIAIRKEDSDLIIIN